MKLTLLPLLVSPNSVGSITAPVMRLLGKYARDRSSADTVIVTMTMIFPFKKKNAFGL